MTHDEFPEKGERAERAPNVSKRRGMHWTCENPPWEWGMLLKYSAISIMARYLYR